MIGCNTVETDSLEVADPVQFDKVVVVVVCSPQCMYIELNQCTEPLLVLIIHIIPLLLWVPIPGDGVVYLLGNMLTD